MKMNHYEEVDFRGNHFKIGNKVWTLNGGHKREQYLIDIFDDIPFEDSDYVTKCCYTADSMYSNIKSYNRLEEVYIDEWYAENAEQNWKDKYDDYVTSKW